MRRRFFVTQFQSDRAELRGESAEHLQRVLRAAPGQVYELSDGETVRLGKIERVGRDAVEFSLHETVAPRESRLRISLGLAVVKFDRFEWALEKATELGVAQVIPVAAARSERALVTAAAKRASRWQRILLESAQQSRRLRPPGLLPLVSVGDFLAGVKANAHAEAIRIWLSEAADAPPLRDILSRFPRGERQSAIIVIGPEGGWTDDENRATADAGFSAASLGPRILRTETAVVAAISAVNYALGD
ncbi:MAG TPA: RsmE family RNA methyltransferase [Candidatus Acidoferrales bacterium]|nr:RsmE family RNA methyltransferase [Candidatus Acidoferrales bacterium]